MPDLNDRHCWIFDLDGTLTRPVLDFQHIRSELGIAPSQDILATIAATPEPRRSQLAERLDQLERHYAALAEPAQGVLHLLVHLQNRGARLGILTRNTRAVALSSLQAIGAAHFFEPDAVLGRDEVRPKPDPHGIEHLLARWQCRAHQAVMVGDFRYDLEVGRAAGTATVHVARQEADLWPELTDLRVDSLTQLLDLME
ncbi:HAD family hydrolase [Marinobacterium arenosum]|uniref:HAD family hydrolase n=1 Tax=Marinobacterium arenosum TaxID=2862496 RepID=UPI001C966686|nr:HAD family hydrolase [Marinobacterium arenosum]MBY4677989.1 HAD family hydrolase [Marinobacterium arenosum]